MRLVLALLCTTAAASAQCLDQSFLPASLNNGLEITANQTVTQTFTVGVAGALAAVEIANINHHRGTPSQPLEVRVVATDPAGVPNGATLASVTFQPNQVPATRGTLRVDVHAAGIAVTPGMVLGIRLSSTAQPGTQTYGWRGEVPGSYAAGMLFLRDTSALSVWDLSFQTFVVGPATSRNYGTGHPGTNGVPSLTTSAPPALGTTVDLQLGNSVGNATVAALLLGLGPANNATPFGGTLLVQPITGVTVPVPAAGQTVPFIIPNNPPLCGLSVHLQTILVDAGASHGLAFSRGLDLAVGS